MSDNMEPLPTRSETFILDGTDEYIEMTIEIHKNSSRFY